MFFALTLLFCLPSALIGADSQLELNKLRQVNVILEYLEQDLLVAPSKSTHARVASRAVGDHFLLSEYHTLDQIYDYLNKLSGQFDSVQVITVGYSTEQRPIKAVQVINNATDQDLIWLDSLTHAREWITGATLLYMLDSLVVGNKQAGISFRKNYIIIPVVNPDGYAHTWISDRMWRKTRSQSSGSGCIGVDINRNYNHTFGGYGSSNETCSEVYKGSSALSEPETRALSKLLFSLKDRVKFFLTIHSFSQYWTCPHAYTNKPSKSFNKHMHVLRAIQKAVYQAEGLKYQIGPYGKLVYLASGFSLDFAYETCAIEHSYLVELRDEGAEGFNLSASQIIPTARETLAGLNAGLEIVFGHSEIV